MYSAQDLRSYAGYGDVGDTKWPPPNPEWDFTSKKYVPPTNTCRRIFFPNNGCWFHIGRAGWMQQRFGKLKTVRTIIFFSNANGCGPQDIEYYALNNEDGSSRSLITSRVTMSNYNTYGNWTLYPFGINCNISCYGVRIWVNCRNEVNNYSASWQVEIYVG
jgi:hypothetical protein